MASGRRWSCSRGRCRGLAGSVTTSIDGFLDTLTEMCKETYEDDVKALRKNVQKAGRKTVSELHATSPSRTGRYAKGWRSKTEVDSDDHISCTVYNATDYQLTHLLEKGHEQFYMGHDTGHRFAGKRHIEPAYESGKQILLGGE